MRGRNKKVFTSGDVAAICNVAPRTVSKWFDSGRLKGYRIPGSDDRRIPRESLIRFLKEHGMPLGELAAADVVLVVGPDDRIAAALSTLLTEADEWDIRSAVSMFEAGAVIREAVPVAVVLDFAVGRADCRAVARRLKDDTVYADTLVIGLAADDETDTTGLLTDGFRHVLQPPVDFAAVAAVIQAIAGDDR